MLRELKPLEGVSNSWFTSANDLLADSIDTLKIEMMERIQSVHRSLDTSKRTFKQSLNEQSEKIEGQSVDIEELGKKVKSLKQIIEKKSSKEHTHHKQRRSTSSEPSDSDRQSSYSSSSAEEKKETKITHHKRKKHH